MKLGEYLVSKGAVSDELVQEALDTQRFRKMKLGRMLRALGHLSQGELNHHLDCYFRDSKPVSVQEILDRMAPRVSPPDLEIASWAQDEEMELVSRSQLGLTLLGTEFKDECLEEADLRFKRETNLIQIDPDGMKFIRSAAGITIERKAASIAVETTLSDDQKIGARNPYTQVFRDVVVAAKEMGASDIHVQPDADGLEIRIRVNGDMLTWRRLSVEHRRPFVNEVKRLVNLSIATRGKAQDGRVSFRSWNIDLRVSLLPSQHDEKIVLRLLDLNRRFELRDVGFDDVTFTDLMKALQAKNGVIVISGPTGSGKTTTLYTLLCALDRKSKNIITLEDPIEYAIEGLTQVQVNRKLSFSEALRSVLRQDPDVILVGEIRDSETADLCVKAASTGHLVLTTLHANGAAEVVGRLANLGIDPFMLKSVLRFSAAQRLLKKLCSDCSVILNSGPSGHPKYRTRNLTGCPKCQKGVIGRSPILEYMTSEQIRRYLESGMRTDPELKSSLKLAALSLAEKGEVDYEEAIQVE